MTFTEIQRFNQWWIWLLLAGLFLIPFYSIYKEFIKTTKSELSAFDNPGWIIMTFAIAMLILFMTSLRLTTSIDEDKIHIRFSPLTSKTFEWNDIKSAELIKYGFVGGWGIRLWTKYGTVYNVKGDMGLAIHMKNGKKYVIGTQKVEELSNYLKSIGKLNLP
jgi:hypothetical protein